MLHSYMYMFGEELYVAPGWTYYQHNAQRTKHNAPLPPSAPYQSRCTWLWWKLVGVCLYSFFTTSNHYSNLKWLLLWPIYYKLIKPTPALYNINSMSTVTMHKVAVMKTNFFLATKDTHKLHDDSVNNLNNNQGFDKTPGDWVVNLN